MKFETKEISPSNNEAKELFQLLDAHNMSHCPPEICHLIQPEELEQVDSTLLGVFHDGKPCGMGGVKFYGTYAEITRMYVKEDYRGNGIAEGLLQELELKARNKGIPWLKLETSDKFKPAYSLYEKHGFSLCKPFGEYVEKPYNTYMSKKIGEAPNKSIERDFASLAPHAGRYKILEGKIYDRRSNKISC